MYDIVPKKKAAGAGLQAPTTTDNSIASIASGVNNQIDPEAIGTEFGETKYHTVVTVFEPDTVRNDVEYDYAEELLLNPNNTMLEIERKQPARSATRENHPNTSSKLLSDDMITVNSEKSSGKTQYSLSDSDGKQLSKEQQDYFKDSKLRDENGNLKVMYHGSQDAGFHTFEGTGEQVKETAAVTYDDSGNMIPLSERFNAKTSDIRRSLSEVGEAPTKHGNWHISGEDVKLAPLPQDVQQTSPATQGKENCSPRQPGGADTPLVNAGGEAACGGNGVFRVGVVAERDSTCILAPVGQKLRYCSVKPSQATPRRGVAFGSVRVPFLRNKKQADTRFGYLLVWYAERDSFALPSGNGRQLRSGFRPAGIQRQPTGVSH